MSNRLKHETSPYLLQHAENPVDWHPWDEQSLDLARRENKPILLSVGYSACHWCHVMAHESFEDDATATVMNELFVNIKVDREERPDLDRIYQIAHQMFVGRGGGWPLTAFLTPNEHVPIFVGTYFPKAANYGMPAFKDVLTRVESYYRTHLAEIRDSGSKLVDALERMDADTTAEGSLDDTTVARARQRLGESFDAEHGGFGQAPKFPHPTHLDLLIEVGERARLAGNDDVGARRMVELSLGQMAARGLYDHLGGGFFRYSVDARWAIPHFEKMLYDNAALLATYSDAAAAYGRDDFARIASETADWVLRDMQDASGGFYATLDADSEGREGKFYVWTPEQIDAVLDPSLAALAKRQYGLEEPANFEQHFWHLQRSATDARNVSPAGLELCRAKLRAAREQRVWPGRDEKVLVAWNGLMIIGLARAARFLGRPELAAAAAGAVDFLRAELWSDGRLKATFKDGQARFAAYLDDYAFLAFGLVELLQTRFRAADLRFAIDLVEVLLARFADAKGGFYFTSDDHERLIHRPKPLGDEAIPSGNGMAALALSALGHLLGEPRYLDAASGTLRAAQASIERYPEAHATLLRALQLEVTPPELVIVRANETDASAWRSMLDVYRPGRYAFLIPNDAGPLPGVLAERSGRDSTVAYLCRGLACSSPIETPEALARLLD